MNERPVTHATFVIEREYKASPARVFAAWSDPAAKSAWFSKADSFEFRVGGHEITRGTPPGGGPDYLFEARYADIVPDRRIVYAYLMELNGVRISVSLVSVELQPVSKGTRLIYTEQGAFLDGLDSPEQREHGMTALLDKLGETLEGV